MQAPFHEAVHLATGFCELPALVLWSHLGLFSKVSPSSPLRGEARGLRSSTDAWGDV